MKPVKYQIVDQAHHLSWKEIPTKIGLVWYEIDHKISARAWIQIKILVIDRIWNCVKNIINI